MLRTIIAISGKSGLFRLISQGRGMLIVESLVDGKRGPIQARDRVIALGDISMYTNEEDAPLSEVLTSLYNVQKGEQIDLSSLTEKDALFESFAQVLPSFDRERVYPSDIKKLYTWYNVLIGAGITTFQDTEEAETEA